MAWTGHFVDTSYRERAEFLYNFLQLWDICSTNTETAFFDTLKFIVGGIMLRKNPRYISENAENESENCTNEHTVPCKVLADYLIEKLKDDRDSLTKDFLEDFIEKFSGLGKITNSENENLNNKGLKQKLPENITVDDILKGRISHSIRYEKAGIKIKEID